MQFNLRVNEAVLLSNYTKAKKLCNDYGVSCSVMVKDFYRFLGLQDVVDCTVWGVDVNYKIFGNNPAVYKAGMFVSEEEALLVNIMCSTTAKRYGVYIPVNLGDDREGLTEKEAVILMKAIEHNCDRMHVIGAVITSGCINGNTPEPDELNELAARLKAQGFSSVSVGGSFYLGWVEAGILPRSIDDVRIGEYALYGTIPYFPLSESLRGRQAITLKLEVLAYYADRGQALLHGGSTIMDKEDTVALTGKVVGMSTEYTILQCEEELEVGSTVTLVPSYHSLIKLARL